MNIYTLRKDDKKWDGHIGKRYAAGIWCWDCKIKATHDILGLFWWCSKCGQRTSDVTLFNPAFRELGFEKSKEKKRVGVNGASGFIWNAENKKQALSKLRGIKKVKTEYGEYWSIQRFKQMFLEVIQEDYEVSEFS